MAEKSLSHACLHLIECTKKDFCGQLGRLVESSRPLDREKKTQGQKRRADDDHDNEPKSFSAKYRSACARTSRCKLQCIHRSHQSKYAAR